MAAMKGGRYSIVFIAAALVVAGCRPADDRQGSSIGTLSIPIIDGTLDAGHPQVGIFLIDAQGGTARSFCSATVVGTKTVLTATHCLDPTVNNLFQLDGKLHQVDHLVENTGWNPSISVYLNDIGLVILASPISGLLPAEVSTAPPHAGQPITLVGMGITKEGNQDAGQRRKASNSVATLGSGYFTVEGTGGGTGNICYGDSGGPVLATVDGREQIVGVASGQSGACGTTSYHVDAAAHYSFLTNGAGGDLYTHDSIPPTVSISSPADGATVAQTLTLAVSAADNFALASVEALVDGASSGTKTTAPFDFALTLAPGARSLRAVAKDLAGNSSSAQVQVTVQAPPLTDSGPPPPPDSALPPPPDSGPPPPPDSGPLPPPLDSVPWPPPREGGLDSSAGDSSSAADSAAQGTGQFGAPCSGDGDCSSGLCRAFDGQLRCTQRCSAASQGCPGSGSCVPGSVFDELVCEPPAAADPTPDSGGCSCALLPDVEIDQLLALLLICVVCGALRYRWRIPRR